MQTEPIEIFCIVAFIIMVAWWIGKWCNELPFPPDPWDAAITEKLNEPDAIPVCHHCFTPQEHDRWFCPECGFAIGPYNNCMPFIYIFSIGEVARVATFGRVRRTSFNIVGFVLFGLFEYSLFAPLFWYFFYLNQSRWPVSFQPNESAIPEEPPSN